MASKKSAILKPAPALNPATEITPPAAKKTAAKKRVTAKKVATAKVPAKKAAQKVTVENTRGKAPAAQDPRGAAKKVAVKPSLDTIARAAYLNYRRRVEQGLAGDSHSDWLEAERQSAALG